MSSNFRKVVGSFAFAAATIVGAQAQSWSICLDPNDPYSDDYSIGRVANELMVAAMGFSGTVTYNAPCYSTGTTRNAAGRIGFAVGNTGSVQSTFDDGMALTVGMPNDPAGAWSYAITVTDDTKTRFGENGLSAAYVGLSDRYIYAETTNDDILIKCRIDVLGDAARIQWNLTNTGADPHSVALWFGQYIGLFSGSTDPGSGAQIAGGLLGQKIPYVYIPGQKPILDDHRWNRTTDASTFPGVVRFDFSQTSPYGLRVDNNRPAEISDATLANEFVIGNGNPLMGAVSGDDETFNDAIQPDTSIGDCGYIQKFPAATLAPNGTRTIIQYYRSTWGVGDYNLPYAAVVDAPKLISTEDDGTSTSDANGLFKNPFPVRVYIDNVGGYSNVNNGFRLSDVKVKLTLPTGLNFVGSPTSTRTKQLTISAVDVKEIKFVDFQVEADGIEFGELPYQVDISSTPGSPKKLTGTIQVAATPRYRLIDNGGPTANAITTPFVFSDSSWETVLGLSAPSDFEAYEYDPQIGGYVLSTSAGRGKGYFIVNKTGTLQSNTLGGTPTVPPDTIPNPNDNVGTYYINLKKGWNLIGNPFNYPVTLGQLTGVPSGSSTQSYAWTDLVKVGSVDNLLAYWNAETQSYVYLQKTSDLLKPNTAYWINVKSSNLTLSFPPVFAEGLPGSSRSETDWTQSAKQWRLKLTARSNNSIDDDNYIGVAKSADEARLLSMSKPPLAPTQKLALSVEDQIGGQTTRLTRAFTDRKGRQEYKVVVQADEAGEVNLTWPNMSTVPKSVRFRLIDPATNVTRDMRTTSSYSFTAKAGTTRELKVQVEVGVATKALIGNVVVTRSTTRVNGVQTGPFSINYTLGNSATTTVRILGAGGKEIFTITRGRADNAGENSVSWNLKDNANRTVAPGTYQVEITATSAEGENVRRFIPVTVIR
ncbi:MAG: hypothetical protein J0H02_09245 [Armatimonadetes bacterium]|nr:hypothetical protein [Armatimonadota bacterium]